MEVEKYRVVEWTIENFSCWNSAIHGEPISSPKWLATDKTLELIPKCIRGHEEYLVARLRIDSPVRFVGDLSFISSDGSLLCRQQVDSKQEVMSLELPAGPKYKEVVARIEKNGAFKGDRLTLRCREKCSIDSVQYRRTTIRAYDVFFKIIPDVLNDLKSSTAISWVDYPLSGDGLKNDAYGRILLYSYKDQLDNAKIELVLMTTADPKVSVLTRMTVLNNGDVVRTEENEHLFQNEEKWTFSNSLTIEEVAKEGFSLMLYFKIIPDISCKHSFDLQTCCFPGFSTFPSIELRHHSTTPSKEHVSKIITDVSNQPDNSLKILSKELMCLYQDQDFSDFQLKCGTVSFPLHKNILSARSCVFKTMFSTDMKEAASGCMDIEDLEPSTLGLFLTYLYTGVVEDLQGESALKLYYAADKYQVTTLKRECADFLSVNVSISNVCDILSLADKYQDDQLASAAHQFILKNYNDVLRSEEWRSLMRNEPLLVAETVTRFAAKDYVKTSVSS